MAQNTSNELPEMVIEDASGDFALEGEKTIWLWGKLPLVQVFRVFKMPDIGRPDRIPVGEPVIDDSRNLTIEEAKRKRDAYTAAIEIAEEMKANG